MDNRILLIIAIIATTTATTITIQIGIANAGHPTSSSDVASCIGDGHYDGRHNPFSQELYDICGDTYYDAFIEGCMSVEDNSREDCVDDDNSEVDASDNQVSLKVKVHFDHADKVCVVESGDTCSVPNGKRGEAGDTVTFTFRPGEIEVGEEIMYCFESWHDCDNATNGPEKEPIHIYN